MAWRNKEVVRLQGVVEVVQSLIPWIIPWVCDVGQLLTSGECNFPLGEMDSTFFTSLQWVFMR